MSPHLDKRMAGDDPRKVIGARVTTRAKLITSEAECKRRYGSNWATKVVEGIVKEAIRAEQKKRASYFILAEWKLGEGHTKVAKANIRSVQSVDVPKNVACEDTAVTDVSSLTLQSPTTAVAAAVVPPQLTANDRREVANNVTPTSLPKDKPVCTSHGVDWYVDRDQSLSDINGPVPYRQWYQTDTIGNRITENSNPTKLCSCLDYFFLMFPPKQLSLMVELTNIQLAQKGKKLTTKGEIVRFLGVCILITRFECPGGRRTLWSKKPISKYIPAPALGKTEMSRPRFDDLWSCIRFSRQPEHRPAGMSSETYRWSLVQDFVDNFNKH